jgi:hypothetical protein
MDASCTVECGLERPWPLRIWRRDSTGRKQARRARGAQPLWLSGSLGRWVAGSLGVWRMKHMCDGPGYGCECGSVNWALSSWMPAKAERPARTRVERGPSHNGPILSTYLSKLLPPTLYQDRYSIHWMPPG